MAQHYSNKRREHEATALPDVETFEMAYAWCPDCETRMEDEDASGHVHCLECGRSQYPLETVWFWWTCMPGCLPDGEPNGPFETEAEAVADAQDDLGDGDGDDDGDVQEEN